MTVGGVVGVKVKMDLMMIMFMLMVDVNFVVPRNSTSCPLRYSFRESYLFGAKERLSSNSNMMALLS